MGELIKSLKNVNKFNLEPNLKGNGSKVFDPMSDFKVDKLRKAKKTNVRKIGSSEGKRLRQKAIKSGL